jgi:hypothetical protein
MKTRDAYWQTILKKRDAYLDNDVARDGEKVRAPLSSAIRFSAKSPSTPQLINLDSA